MGMSLTSYTIWCQCWLTALTMAAHVVVLYFVWMHVKLLQGGEQQQQRVWPQYSRRNLRHTHTAIHTMLSSYSCRCGVGFWLQACWPTLLLSKPNMGAFFRAIKSSYCLWKHTWFQFSLCVLPVLLSNTVHVWKQVKLARGYQQRGFRLIQKSANTHISLWGHFFT